MRDTGVLKAIDAACADIRQEAIRRVRESEAWRDSELERYDEARQALAARRDGREAVARPSGTETAAPTSSPSTSVAGKKTRASGRRKQLSTSPRSVEKRRRQVARFIEESSDPVDLRGIAEALGITKHTVRTAIYALEAEGRVRRVGEGNSIRYTTGTRTSSAASKQAPTQGTIAERILAVIRDRSHASAEELSQALGESLGRVVTASTRLEREGRVRKGDINGRAGYVLVRPV